MLEEPSNFGALTESSKFHYAVLRISEYFHILHVVFKIVFAQAVFNRKKKCPLILDNASWHKTQPVKKILEENKPWIKESNASRPTLQK